MLYVYLGTDTKRTGETLLRATESMRERVPQAHSERFTGETEFLDIAGLLASSGLFHAARIIVLDGVCERAESKQELFSFLKEMGASEHVFFVRERALTAPEMKKIENHAVKVVRYDLPEKKEAAFSMFSVADALLAKDRKELWTRLVLALRAGSEPEELHGILFWGAKNMVLAAGAATPEEAGLHPFVYKKTRAALLKFKEGEVYSLVSELAALPHEARRTVVDLEYALEKFALSL